METINIGDVLTCAETGKTFIAAQDGITFNYAQDHAGNVYSDEGVDIRERRELLDRSRPFGCYISGDGKHATGWKGNILGTVIAHSSARNGWASSEIHYWRVRDVHGHEWYGRNAGTGMFIALRATKA